MIVGRKSTELKAGVDYPATFSQLQSWFVDDSACRRYLERLRWPDGFCCPVCEAPEAWRSASGAWMCRDLRPQDLGHGGHGSFTAPAPRCRCGSPRCGSCAHRRTGLGARAAAGARARLDATAWAWLHKLRRAMVDPERDLLDGLVEVDETYFGARGSGDGRGTSKTLIASRRGGHCPPASAVCGLARVPDASGTSPTRLRPRHRWLLVQPCVPTACPPTPASPGRATRRRSAVISRCARSPSEGRECLRGQAVDQLVALI